MSATQVIITLLGFIALLLWGIHMVQSGILRAYGSSLRRSLNRGLDNRFKAFAAGFAVTAVLQSSTATGLMASSFAAGRLVDLVPALAIMLGANVGTTVIVQILSFDIGLLTPILILAGVIAFKQGGQTRTRDLGRVAIGLGLVLLSLRLLTETVMPHDLSPQMQDVLHVLTSDPMVTLLLAAIFTWAAHASVAAVLLVMSLAAAGWITPVAALAMVLGANLGSALNPVLQAMGGDREKLRVPVGNLLNRLIGCAIALPLLPYAVEWLGIVDGGPARQAANFHTAFNLALAALFILPLPALAMLMRKLFPATVRSLDPGAPLHLDRDAIENPSVALTNAAREALRMADAAEQMLRGSQLVFETSDRKLVSEISRMDDTLDQLYGAIKRYLTDISREQLDEEQSQRLSEILAFTINLEHIGDIIDRNLMDLASKKIKRQLSFSEEGLGEISQMHARLLEHLKLSISVFMASDLRSARQLVAEKEQFRDLEKRATERHFARLREGRSESIETTELHLDIVRDLKRIESHIAATAYPLLEQLGALRRSRLTEAKS